eukprot:gene13433-15831_t
MAAVTGGNLTAVTMLHRQGMVSPFPALQAIGEAFMCGHMDVVRYIVENVDLDSNNTFLPALPMNYLPQTRTNELVTLTLKPRHASGYIYLCGALSSAKFQRIFGNHPFQVMSTCSIPLFNEMLAKVGRGATVLQTVKVKMVEIFEAKAHKYLRLVDRHDDHNDIPGDLLFIDYLDHVLRACASDGKNLRAIKDLRLEASTLTAGLTPGKATVISLLLYFNKGPFDTSAGLTNVNFQGIASWSEDLQLAPFLLETFGINTMCSEGASLPMVQAGLALLNDFSSWTTEAFQSNNIEVLRYLHDRYPDFKCSTDRLIDETNLEIIKFFIETQPKGSLEVSLSSYVRGGDIEILRYLQQGGVKFRNIDHQDDDYYNSLYHVTIEVIQYLVDQKYDLKKFSISIDRESDLPMVQLYIKHLDANDSSFIDNVKAIMHDACTSGLLNIVQYIHSLLPTTDFGEEMLDYAFGARQDHIVEFILANRSERYGKLSWTTAGSVGSIELFEHVRTNSGQCAFYPKVLESANINGRLDLIKHIVELHPNLECLSSCLTKDQYHVLDYYLGVHSNSVITPDLIRHTIKMDAIHCAQVLLAHLPVDHPFTTLTDYIESHQ